MNVVYDFSLWAFQNLIQKVRRPGVLCVDLEPDNKEYHESVVLSVKKESVTREKKVILSYCYFNG